jgi:hypothetical protein
LLTVWIADSWMTGAEGDATAGPWIQHTVVRYYVDGEDTPSIEFSPALAAGVGFDDNFVCASSCPSLCVSDAFLFWIVAQYQQ